MPEPARASESLRILHTVENYPPSTGGMQEVVRQISEHLVRRGHSVTVGTSRLPDREEMAPAGVRIETFDVTGNSVLGIRGEAGRYQDFLRDSRFDVVTNFAAQQWATDLAFPVLDEIPSRKVFVPTGFSGLYRPEYADYYRAMGSHMKKYDMNVFLSWRYRDIRFAMEHGIDRIAVIPNGAAEDEFLEGDSSAIRQSLGIPGDHFLILHVGSHTGWKGHEEAIRIFRKADIRNATLLIVANPVPGGCERSCAWSEAMHRISPAAFLAGKRLIVASLPRADTVKAYREADLFLFPSRIECSPLVLFECMASGTPFLSSDVGNAGEIVEWSGGGELLPTRIDAGGYSDAEVGASARALERLAKDPLSRERMKISGRAAWLDRFTWSAIGRSYEALYLGLARV